MNAIQWGFVIVGILLVLSIIGNLIANNEAAQDKIWDEGYEEGYRDALEDMRRELGKPIPPKKLPPSPIGVIPKPKDKPLDSASCAL